MTNKLLVQLISLFILKDYPKLIVMLRFKHLALMILNHNLNQKIHREKFQKKKKYLKTENQKKTITQQRTFYPNLNKEFFLS